MVIDNRSLIEARLPPAGQFPAKFVFSLHKAGSSLLSAMVGGVCELAGIPSITIPDLMFEAGVEDEKWRHDKNILRLIHDGRIYFGFRYLPEFLLRSDFFTDEHRHVLLVRDPRDALVSQFFSYGGSHFSHTTNERISQYLLTQSSTTRSLDIDSYVVEVAPDYLDKLTNYRKHLNVRSTLLCRYEQLYFCKREFLAAIFLHFGIEVPPDILDKVAAENDIRPTTEDPTKHIRKGLPGDHREKLRPDTIRKLNDIFRDTCKWFGYDLDSEDVLQIADGSPAISRPMEVTHAAALGFNGGPWTAKTHSALYPHNLNVGLARFLIDHVRPRTLLEFGSGVGLLAKAVAAELAIGPSYCIEPKVADSGDLSGYPTLLNIDIFDQPAPAILDQKFDLVVSIEVAEHVPRDKHEVLFDFLAARALRCVVFSAARPGQGGHGHVAERPEEEWRQEWTSRGFVFDARLTALARNLSDHKNINHRRNLLVFRAPSNFDALTQIEVQARPYLQDLLGIVRGHSQSLDGNLFYVNLHGALGGMPDDALRIKRNNLLALGKRARNTLEIGFNAGHSALIFLLGNPSSKLTVVDQLSQPYALACFNYLKAVFPSRLVLVAGDSRSVLGSLTGQQFDLVHIDGGKELTIESDLCATRSLVAPDHVVVIDDTQNIALDAVVQRFEKQGKLCLSAFANLNAAAQTRRWPHKIGRFVDDSSNTTALTRLKHIFESSTHPSIYTQDGPDGLVVGFARAQCMLLAMQTVENAQISGAFVEVGVAAGHASVVAALGVSRFIPREFWLYDTFEGFTNDLPDELDHEGRSIRDYDLGKYSGPDCSVDSVRSRMLAAGVEVDRLFLVKGPIEQTALAFDPGPIAILRLDVDLFAPTLAALQAFYDRLVPGGWLIIDDYGHWQGCRAAVDQFFAKRGEQFAGHALDYTCYAARKVRMAAATFTASDLDASVYEF